MPTGATIDTMVVVADESATTTTTATATKKKRTIKQTKPWYFRCIGEGTEASGVQIHASNHDAVLVLLLRCQQ